MEREREREREREKERTCHIVDFTVPILVYVPPKVKIEER